MIGSKEPNLYRDKIAVHASIIGQFLLGCSAEAAVASIVETPQQPSRYLLSYTSAARWLKILLFNTTTILAKRSFGMARSGRVLASALAGLSAFHVAAAQSASLLPACAVTLPPKSISWCSR